MADDPGRDPVEPDDIRTGSPSDLELAREIRREVERFVADDAADVASLSDALDAIPRREQLAMARQVFDRLEPAQQWAVLERLLGDDGLRESLGEEQRTRLAEFRRQANAADVVAAVVDGSRLDLSDVPVDTEVVLGLFRPEDVRGAAGRGRLSDVCARQLVLRTSGEPGAFRVVDDVFNPRGGLFVSAAYDLSVWEAERLDGHSTVRIGSLADGPGGSDLEPVLYQGARVDVGVGDEMRPGHLLLGWVTIAGIEVDADLP